MAGDRNTTFFHTKASNQYQRNAISRIMDANNGWIEVGDQIGQTFVRYFEELFTTSRSKVEQEMIDAVHPKVTKRIYSYPRLSRYGGGEGTKTNAHFNDP